MKCKPAIYDTGRAICVRCGYHWLALAPAGRLLLQCPCCLTSTGGFVAYDALRAPAIGYGVRAI